MIKNISATRIIGQQTNPQGTFVAKGLWGYLLAAACAGVALWLRVIWDPIWGHHAPFISFFLAQLIVVRFTTRGPFIFSGVASVLLADWFFMEPRHSLFVSDRVNVANTLLFILINGVVLALSERTRTAFQQERAARTELEKSADELGRLAAIVESSDDAIIGKTLDGTITSWNASAEKLYGYTPNEVMGKSIGLLAPAALDDTWLPLLERVRKGEQVSHFEAIRQTKDGRLIDVSLSISPVRNRAGDIVGASTIARDITEKKRAEAERERLLEELQTALANVKTLGGLLPICSHCKKIRDDKGYWNQIELFIRDRSNAKFSHGICPDCAREHYPGLFPAQSAKP